MSWLDALEEYLPKWQGALAERGFERVSSKDGPGMGGMIAFSNDALRMKLINDRSQFAVEINAAGRQDQGYDLSFMLSMVELNRRGKRFRELTASEKDAIYRVSCSLTDPLRSFFEHYEEIEMLLDRKHLKRTTKELSDFFSERGEWLFPG